MPFYHISRTHTLAQMAEKARKHVFIFVFICQRAATIIRLPLLFLLLLLLNRPPSECIPYLHSHTTGRKEEEEEGRVPRCSFSLVTPPIHSTSTGESPIWLLAPTKRVKSPERLPKRGGKGAKARSVGLQKESRNKHTKVHRLKRGKR